MFLQHWKPLRFPAQLPQHRQPQRLPQAQHVKVMPHRHHG